MTLKKKRPKLEKTDLEKVPTRTPLKSIRKNLHDMVIEAELAIDKQQKRKGCHRK